MTALQQQNEQMAEQLAALQTENANLQITALQMTNALASIQAAGSTLPPEAGKAAQVGAASNPIWQARETMARRPAVSGGLLE